MNDPLDGLEAELAAAFADLRAPREVTAAAKGLFTWRTIDAELAALHFDSLVDAEQGSVRAADGPRTVAFETGEVEIEVEIAPGPGVRRLVGQLAPVTVAEIDVETDGAVSSTVRADEHGRFAADLPAAASRLALRVRIAGRAEIATSPTPV